MARRLIRYALTAAVMISLLTLSPFIFAGSDALKGKPAPAFSLKSLDGTSISLEQLKGGVVLVDFWATWCPNCRESLPHIQALSSDKELAKQGLHILAINAKEPTGPVLQFVHKFKYSLPVLLDQSGSATRAYEISVLPATFIIGRNGTVREVFVGQGEEGGKEIDEAIKAALAGK